MFGQFSGVAIAGQTYGFDNSHPEYKAAILKVDEQIGRIMTALKQRATYAQEDWLVVVTSGKGGPFQLDLLNLTFDLNHLKNLFCQSCYLGCLAL